MFSTLANLYWKALLFFAHVGERIVNVDLGPPPGHLRTVERGRF